MKLNALLISLLLLASFCAASQSDDVKSVLRRTADDLGWPNTLTPREGAVGENHQITWYPGDDQQFAFISITSSDQEASSMLDILEENGMTRGTFHGRDAIVMHDGDQICNAGGQVGWWLDFIRGMVSLIAPEADTSDICAESYGTIVWTCGNLVFGIQDQTGNGNERMIADALYKNVESQNLCGMGDTVVILAKTSDFAGTKTLADFDPSMAEDVNDYYYDNGYQKVGFEFTFKDADGAAGSSDWYTIPGTRASYNGKEVAYVEAAIREAFKNNDLPDDVFVERVIVVYPGKAQQEDGSAPLSTSDSWKPDNYFLEIDAGAGKTKFHVPNMIVVSEYDSLGDWSHEIGHSLYCKYKTDGKWNRINDRYNYNNPAWKYGKVEQWGIMGSGNYWGSPTGSQPTHMCGYTKEAANWLRYKWAKPGSSYELTAIEDMGSGDFLLRIDDPNTVDPLYYFIVEARKGPTYNGQATDEIYPAPETGVMFYQVKYDHANTHEIVNFISPNAAPFYGNKYGRWYPKPILYNLKGAGNKSTSYFDPNAQIILKLTDEGIEADGSYTAMVEVQEYNVTNMLGLILESMGLPFSNAPFPDMHYNAETPKPDLDLHAYDSTGNHVGMNYQTGLYENNVPGAIASGDLMDGTEWIFAPSGTTLRFEVSSHDTQEFLNDYPQFASQAVPETYKTKFVKFDSLGNRLEAEQPEASIPAGSSNSVSEPSSSDYEQVEIPGFNNNSEGGLCCCLPGLIVLLVSLGMVGCVRS